MAEKGSNNWLWWTIGGIATLGLGLGIYYYLRSGKDATAKEEEEKKKATENKGVTLPPPPPSPPTSTTTTTTATATDPETPTNFNNKEQGNAFRRWVRAKDPTYAEKIDLSASGEFDNSYIRKAYAKYGNDFQKVNSEVLDKAFKLLVLNDSDWGKTDDKYGIAERYYESGDANNGARISFDRNGRVYIQGRKNGAYGSKWRAGGWYLRGDSPLTSSIQIFINGKEYNPTSPALSLMKNDLVWAIWKDGGLWSGSAFSPFDGGNMGMTKFGFSTDGTKLQDVML
jgi:hypothetical protein